MKYKILPIINTTSINLYWCLLALLNIQYASDTVVSECFWTPSVHIVSSMISSTKPPISSWVTLISWHYYPGNNYVEWYIFYACQVWHHMNISLWFDRLMRCDAMLQVWHHAIWLLLADTSHKLKTTSYAIDCLSNRSTELLATIILIQTVNNEDALWNTYIISL